MLLLAGCNHAPSVPVTVRTATAEDVLQAVREPGAKVVLVNMWASWCAPCRQEFPDLMKLTRNYRERGLRVVLVSWDDKAGDAQKFLQKQGVDFPTYMKSSSQSDTKFVEAFGPQWTGAFPATMIYDGSGKLRHFWEGKSSYRGFEEKVEDVLLNMNQTGGKL